MEKLQEFIENQMIVRGYYGHVGLNALDLDQLQYMEILVQQAIREARVKEGVADE